MLRALALVRESLLTLVAVVGVACILAVVLGFAFKASFVVFRTGSMEPSFPVGALSLVVEVPANHLQPGDVVSVKRPGSGALITHRVVSARSVAGSESGATLLLKGDANPAQDPLPYEVDVARKVLVTVPEVGKWVMAARGPWFILGSTLFLAALVVWAFWPRTVPPDSGDIGDAEK